MYLNFYGLKEKPFNSTPDPKFLYLTPGHREALSQLLYGVSEHKGFIVLTGEVGTGKTTLLRTLLTRLDSNTAVAYLFNSTLPFDELLEYMLHDFGIAKPGETRVERLVALNNFLIDRHRSGQNTVVIFDEAQHLDPPTLERIRLLSNFETTTEKLLQIVLGGQPELDTRLAVPELRQLRQRIGLHCAIPPLRPEEARDYIRTRLRIAGARDLNLFSDRAVRRITEHAAGIPRVINMVCDHCLLLGYGDQTRLIDLDIAQRAIKYLTQGQVPAQTHRRTRLRLQWQRPLKWALGVVAAGAVAAIAALAVHAGSMSSVLSDVHAWWLR
jgi:general secretion pathway protein A